ncbi:MAG: hypothetical protein LBP19_10365 [Treponema sp.]|nr:hypothetical protein [Treponema sp.]
MTKSSIRSAILVGMYFDGLNSGEVLLLAMLNVLIPFLPLSLLDVSPSPLDDTP